MDHLHRILEVVPELDESKRSRCVGDDLAPSENFQSAELLEVREDLVEPHVEVRTPRLLLLVREVEI